MHLGLAVCAALAASAVGAAQRVTREGMITLTDANWRETLSKGAWTVEFYEARANSIEFFPTWDELVKNKANQATDYPDAPFKFAQVDCFASKDLCMREGIDVTPRLFTYWEGKKSETQYIGNRGYADLAGYIDKEAARFRKSKGVSDQPHPSVTSSALASPTQSQTYAQAAPTSAAPEVPPPPPPPSAPAQSIGPAGPNQSGQVVSLGSVPIQDEEALARFLARGSGVGPSFVKFFAPWCPHCKAMKPAYERLGESLKGIVNVLEVDCVANRETCVKYGIQSFPTLRMYNNGQVTEYRGGRSHDAMDKWARKAGSNSGLGEINMGELKNVTRDHEVFFLYLYTAGTPDREQELVQKATSVLMSKQTYAFRSSDQELIDRYGTYLHVSQGTSKANSGALSGLLVFKDNDNKSPVSRFFPSDVLGMADGAAIQKITSWLQAERFPTVVELTGTTFSDVIYNDAKSLVVLAALSDVHHGGNVIGTGSGSQERDLELRAFSDLASKWRASPRPLVRERLIFAWINADRWATAIKTYYKVQPADLPRVVLVEGSRLQYYDLPSDSAAAARGQPWLKETEFFDALEAISQGQVAPKSSKTVIDRTFATAGGFFARFLIAFSNHPYVGVAFILVTILGVFRMLSRFVRSVDVVHQPLLPTNSASKLD